VGNDFPIIKESSATCSVCAECGSDRLGSGWHEHGARHHDRAEVRSGLCLNPGFSAAPIARGAGLGEDFVGPLPWSGPALRYRGLHPLGFGRRVLSGPRCATVGKLRAREERVAPEGIFVVVLEYDLAGVRNLRRRRMQASRRVVNGRAVTACCRTDRLLM
jgi:hypothetical protein